MAGATILLRSGENRALLSNSIIARLVGIGTTWNQIRAGILFQVDGTVSIASLDFALGFCAGTTNVYGDATTTHFVGTRCTSGWPFASSWYSNATFVPSKRVNTTVTDGTALSTTSDVRGDIGGGIIRTMMFIDITKGSPNYTFELFSRTALNTGTPPSEADFLTQMEMATPSFAHHTYSGAQTLAVDEGADGTLDAFQMYWNPATQVAEVSMVGVTVLS